MASIDDLNDQTLWRILQYSIEQREPRLSNWKNDLRLIAVSYRWRSILFQHVFNSAFIEYNDNSHGQIQIDTNTSLFPFHGCDIIASTLTIDMVLDFDIYPALYHVLSCFIFRNLKWSSVRTVNISIKHCDKKLISASHNNRDNDNINRCRLLGTRFAEYLPNVVYLNVDSYHKSVLSGFTSILVNTYGRRLQYLRCPHVSIDRSLLHFSNQLTYLSINFGNVGLCYFPTVFSKMLKYLNISGLPENFSMAHFDDPNEPANVHFVCLTELVLNYTMSKQALHSTNEYKKRPYHCNIYAPNIQIVRLTSPPPDCEALYHLSEFSFCKFELSGKFPCIEYLATMVLNVTNYLYICIANINVATTEECVIAAINHIFSKGLPGLYMKLYIGYPECNFYFQDIHWEYLSELEMHFSIKISALLRIMQNLQNIRIMSVFNVISDSLCVNSNSVFTMSTNDKAQLCPKLKAFSIRCWTSENIPTSMEMVGFLTYILAVLSTIVIFEIPERFIYDVKYFVENNLSRYPHLRKITIFTD